MTDLLPIPTPGFSVHLWIYPGGISPQSPIYFTLPLQRFAEIRSVQLVKSGENVRHFPIQSGIFPAVRRLQQAFQRPAGVFQLF